MNNNNRRKYVKNSISVIMLYVIGLLISNKLFNFEMKWSIFFIFLFSLVLGQVIRYV